MANKIQHPGNKPSNRTTTLKAESLEKVYRGKETVHAVEGVNFQIKEGEFVSIIGPSGSGKSTILRMIAGFEEPTEGSVVLNGVDVTDRAPFDRNTNMMFQDLALFPNYTVSENIEYGPRQDGVPKAEREEIATEMLEMVQLEGYGDRAIDELSGGEQQRVALARCMVNRPSVVLFDEPRASLDMQLRRQMTTELSDIQSRTGSTFLYVTHNQEVALSASDRVIVLNRGEVEQVGTPDELYNNPETEFVANFVGDMNMFASDVREASPPSEPIDVATDPVTGAVGESTDTQGESGSMKIGVRPHDTELARNEEDLWDYYLDGTVRGTMFAGEDEVVTVQTNVGELTAETDLSVDRGESVFVTFSRTDMHHFPMGGNDEY
jgi:spermidine/putrescine transport system ATP-binding protein